eukprot:5727019-Alexandrium_andersonii.AAC.1
MRNRIIRGGAVAESAHGCHAARRSALHLQRLLGAANRALLDVQGGHRLHVLRNRRGGRRGQLQPVDGEAAVKEE